MEAFVRLLSTKTGREPQRYEQWVHKLFQEIYSTRKEIPTYMGDWRIPLPFRKYADNEMKLEGKAFQRLREQHSIRLWYTILSQEWKDELLDIEPKRYMKEHPWAQRLAQEQIDKQTRKYTPLKEMIRKANSRGNALFPCIQCHSKKNVRSHGEQRARSDEGMTIVNVCSKCHIVWTVRG